MKSLPDTTGLGWHHRLVNTQPQCNRKLLQFHVTIAILYYKKYIAQQRQVQQYKDIN